MKAPLMFFSKAYFSGFFVLQLGLYCAARPQGSIACLTEFECDKQRQELGFNSFNVGDRYPAKGCFSKGGKAYFGRGGTSDDKAVSPLAGKKERIWCNASPSQPANSNDSSGVQFISKKPSQAPTTSLVASQFGTACLSRRECNLKQKEMGFAEFLIGGYPTKGCFSSGDTAYFGVGGTAEQRNESPLPGQEKRIWCDRAASIAEEEDMTVDACSDNTDIQVRFYTDEFGEENGFKLSTNPVDGSTPENLLDIQKGSLESVTEYIESVCVSEGTYTLTVYGKSSYSVLIDGEEILFERNRRWSRSSREIIAGYDPSMSDIEKEWLELHNTRRKTYHEKYDTKYRPLQWSPTLAKDASNWVDEIAPTCKVVREPKLEEGENMSVKKYRSPKDNELPENILARWSDFKLDKEYPENQTMTQVMWRATRYIGCARKDVINKDGSYCYISICRYSRPGNCAVRQYDTWRAATLDGRSPCGQTCPEEGCH